MRQQTKPFIGEQKLSRSPDPDAPKPSIWGRLDADIAQGLQDKWMETGVIRITRPPPVVTTAVEH
jgi:hypothetical protein